MKLGIGGATGKRTFLLAARLVTAGLGAIQLSVIARLLPESQLAVVAAGVSLAAYVQLLGEPSILGYERLGHHSRVEDGRALGARHASAVVLFWTVLAIGVGGAIWAAATGEVWNSLGVAAWAVSMVQLRWVTVQYLNWNEQVAFATTLLCNSGARVLAMTIGAWLGGDGGQVLFFGSVGSIAATALVSPRISLLPLRGVPLRALLAVGLPLTISSAAVSSMSSWPTLAGAAVLPVEQFAYYAAQAALTGAVYGVTVGYVVVFGFPQVKKAWDSGRAGEALSITRRYLLYVIGGSSALVVAWWIAGDLLTGLVLGPNYIGHAIPAALSAAFATASVASIVGWQIRVEHRQNILAAVNVFAAVMQVPLILFLVNIGGVRGVIIGIAVTGMLAAVGLVIVCNLPRRPTLLLFVLLSTAVAVAVSMASVPN